MITLHTLDIAVHILSGAVLTFMAIGLIYSVLGISKTVGRHDNSVEIRARHFFIVAFVMAVILMLTYLVKISGFVS